ncbi:MAG: DEAD/DEAH box helicase [Planctomycetota bacterium]|nr:DEAD/DEAH box helicase [Planctomycetota bacterium]
MEFLIPPPLRRFLRDTIARSGGVEVFFLGRVRWEDRGEVAVLQELDVLARGNQVSVPAIIDRAQDWDVALHNHPGGDLEPSASDLDIASELGNRGVGFVIIDNPVERVRVVVGPMPREKSTPVDLDEIRRIFGRDGPLARRLDDYECRAGQLDMALEVARSLNENGVIACEAGTGVGKSFAYLVPSILWATQNREKVVVSTGTIHLQEQLVNKDLPFLEKTLDVDFRYALIKGRNNYACRRKVSELPEEFLVSETDTAEHRKALEELIEWVGNTRDGSRADLPAEPRPEVWERVMSETDKSLKVNCKFYQSCFYYQARRRVNRSHIVVANHHLFFADLAVRQETGNYEYDLVLPAYRRVVFDEAHHLEDVCSDYFGVRFSRRGIRQRLRRMASEDGLRGRLAILGNRLRGWGDDSAAEKIASSYASFVPELADAIDERFEAIEELARAEGAGGPGRRATAEPGGDRHIRLRPEDETLPFWVTTREHLEGVRAEFLRLGRLNDSALHTVQKAKIPEEGRDSVRLELESFGGRLEALVVGLERFVSGTDASVARWLEVPGGAKGGVEFAAAPTRVAPQLAATVYEPLKSVALCSATLSVAGRPDFVVDRLGLSLIPEERFTFRSFASPFDFRRQVLTVVPDDLPEPTERGFEAELPRLVLEILRGSRGRAFVLFTSYSLLRRTHRELEGELVALGLRPLAQGQAQRSELLRRFREGRGVLFGTDSFWEGVDVKGSALELVIITRLPFRVPSHPLQEARVEEIRLRGKSPFAHFTVPQAVLRFKQGFGRLIRSTEDRGVVAVLDRRILSRPYGKTFRASLPPTSYHVGPAAEIVRRVEAFFSTGDGVEPPPAPRGSRIEEPAASAGDRPAPGESKLPPPWEV